MTQEGIVTKLFPNGMAEIAVTRMTACGGNCGSCESCMLQSEVKTLAKNLVSAQPGQRVLIESRSSSSPRFIQMPFRFPVRFLL